MEAIRPSERNCVVGASLVILACFTIFAGDGLFAYFTPDDMMNLYFAWFRPLSEANRPLGAVFYRLMFAAFGLNPLPYRIACFLLLLINLALLYRFCVQMSSSREIGALACLLGSYHAHLSDLYYSTGTIYDLLCCTFFLSAFVYYAGLRQRGTLPRWWQILILLALYIAAITAKEIGVTLPLLLLLYDALYNPAERIGLWIKREARILAGPILVTAAFVVCKLAFGTMVDNPDYRPHFAWSTLVEAWKHYAFDLFYGAVTLSAWRVVLLWVVMLGIAVAARRRALLLGFGIAFLGILPVAFITPRGFFAIYVTLPGWYLFGGTALVALRDLLTTGRPAVFFLVLAVLLFPLHWHEKPFGNGWCAEAHATVRNVLERLDSVSGPLPHNGRVLFLSDPYPPDEWLLTFIFRLHYRDDGIQVDRLRAMPVRPDPVTLASYDRTFRLDTAGLVLVR